MKILNTKESILISTPSNTDGIINKLVTVFELHLLPGPVANAVPGLAQLHVIKIQHRDYFMASTNLLPRHCASEFLQASSTRTNSSPFSWFYTATAPELKIICTMESKTAPYPPRTVTAFWLKYQDSDRCYRRVTLTNYTAGPLAHIFGNVRLSPRAFLIKFILRI